MSRHAFASAFYLAAAVVAFAAAWELASRAGDAEREKALHSDELARARAKRDSAKRRHDLAHEDRVHLEAHRAAWEKAHEPSDDLAHALSYEGWRQITLDPHYEALRQASYRAHLHFIYAKLYRKLGFTPEQQTEFEDLEVDYNGKELDLQAAATASGDRSQDDAIRSLRALNEADARTAETELLGKEAGDALHAFDDESLARGQVERLSDTLYVGANPLSQTQVDQLTAALHQNEKPPEDALPGTIADYAAPVTDWAAARLAAAQILTADQMEEYDSIAAEGQYRDLQRELFRRAFAWEASHPVGPDGR